MKNTALIKILKAFKNGKIDIQKAEEMICNDITLNLQDLPWNNDKKLHVVAFIGKKILKANSTEYSKIEVIYDGDALNVESYGNLTCKNISGNATAGASITCNDIEGNATAGVGIKCKTIKGKAVAGNRIYVEQEV